MGKRLRGDACLCLMWFAVATGGWFGFLELPEEIPYPDYIIQMQEDVREFIENRDTFVGDRDSYESMLKGLRDRHWKFSSAFKCGYHEGVSDWRNPGIAKNFECQ